MRKVAERDRARAAPTALRESPTTATSRRAGSCRSRSRKAHPFTFGESRSRTMSAGRRRFASPKACWGSPVTDTAHPRQLAVGGEGDDGDSAGALEHLEALGGLEAVEGGHGQVHHHHVRTVAQG